MYRTGFRRNYAHVVGTPPPGGGGEQAGVRYASEEERGKMLKLKITRISCLRRDCRWKVTEQKWEEEIS